MTTTTTMETASPATANGGISKFPAFAPDSLSHYDSDSFNRRSTSSPERTPSLGNLRQSLDNDFKFQPPSHNWQARRNSRAQGASHSGFNPRGRGHGRQRSLSEAIAVIRERKGSMSQNAQEIADALKAPVSPQLVVSTAPPIIGLFCRTV
jgi:solute carrier family 35 protein E1